jgi:transposase-like protein
MGSNSKEEIQERAVQMYHKDWKTSAIAKELGVHSGTIRRWFKKRGIPARNEAGLKPEEQVAPDKLAQDIEQNLENMTDAAVMAAKHDARLEEDKAMMEIAESQSTPAAKYQHYMAAAAIKLARDGMKNVRGPRTVKELSELDQLIRRNLGLNSKAPNAASKMQIDISILNNRKADRGRGAIIDIEPNDK